MLQRSAQLPCLESGGAIGNTGHESTNMRLVKVYLCGTVLNQSNSEPTN